MKRSQNYSSLVWMRFKRNKMALSSLILIVFLVLMTIFAPFFSSNGPSQRFGEFIYEAPSTIRFIDTDGNFHLRPFIYRNRIELDPVTFVAKKIVDTTKSVSLEFFVNGWEYEIFGIKSSLHLFGLDDGSPIYIAGSDNLGRDILSRSIYGGRITMLFSAVVVTIVVTVGTLVGLFSGYYGGRFDNITQRIAELALAFPAVPLYLALIAVMPSTASTTLVFAMLILILSSLQWAFIARQVRAQTLALRNLDYVRSAKAVGANDMRIVIRHILPNVTSNVVILATIMLPTIILTESFFSFLSVGVKSPMFSWGSLLNVAGQFQTVGSYPWLLTPVIFILVAVLGFNSMGDGLRDAVDPYSS